MSEQRFVVEITRPVPPEQVDRVARQIATRLELDPERIVTLLDGRIGAVTRPVLGDKADAIAEVFGEAGVRVMVSPVLPEGGHGHERFQAARDAAAEAGSVAAAEAGGGADPAADAGGEADAAADAADGSPVDEAAYDAADEAADAPDDDVPPWDPEVSWGFDAEFDEAFQGRAAQARPRAAEPTGTAPGPDASAEDAAAEGRTGARREPGPSGAAPGARAEATPDAASGEADREAAHAPAREPDLEPDRGPDLGPADDVEWTYAPEYSAVDTDAADPHATAGHAPGAAAPGAEQGAEHVPERGRERHVEVDPDRDPDRDPDDDPEEEADRLGPRAPRATGRGSSWDAPDPPVAEAPGGASSGRHVASTRWSPSPHDPYVFAPEDDVGAQRPSPVGPARTNPLEPVERPGRGPGGFYSPDDLEPPREPPRLRSYLLWALALSLLVLVLLQFVMAARPLGAPPAAAFGSGLAAYRKGDFAAARRVWEPLADHGDPQAQYLLGFMAQNGLGQPWSNARAAVWYRRAAQQGHAEAQLALGDLYLRGMGVEQDLRVGAAWYASAAVGGHPRGQFEYARLLLHGVGVEQDLEGALAWFGAAAANGVAEAADYVAYARAHAGP